MNKTPVSILKSIEILSPLSRNELELLYSYMNTEKYCKGETLFNEGDSGEVMYIVLSGSVSISVNTPDGKVLEIAEIISGNFFGEMSIFDSVVRSATCTPKCDTTVLSLKAADFYEFIKNNPIAGSNIMQQMLKITTLRLNKTGAFLSDIVTWGEQARTRAITDDFTGLYNRRFLDEAFEDRFAEAKGEDKYLSVIMIDLDNFGTLNNEYGQEMGDKVILAVVPIFKKLFRKEDILARYGGDEFTFLLPGTTGEESLSICSKLVKEVRKISLLKNLGGSLKDVTTSIGIACFPDHANSVSGLSEKADQALYKAKEAGRDRAVLWTNEVDEVLTKTGIASIKKRNLIIDNIFAAIVERDCFLVMGHKDPDEDCISSMIAISLLLNKFSKTVCLLIPEKINENFQYLLNICRYNAIELIHNKEGLPCNISTVFFMDTPKPEMREKFSASKDLYNNKDILKIEIDHHLEADSSYIGDRDYCFVDEASSASELVGMMAFKLKNREDIINSFNIQDLFSRNFVLAVLTGIIGDSKMGKYLKTRREKWFYRLFSNMFNEMLTNKTHKDSGNFSTMDEVFTELQQMSMHEDECFTLMMKQKVDISPQIASIIVTQKVIKEMRNVFDHDTIVTVARYAADSLAEYSRTLSLVAYYDDNKDSNLIQFRIRRSHSFKTLDLRTILKVFDIKNGGGHPGAIGFRIPAADVPDLHEYVKFLVDGIEKLIIGAVVGNTLFLIEAFCAVSLFEF